MSGSVNTAGQTTNQKQDQSQFSQLTPYAAANPALQGILGGLSNISPNLSPTQTSAIAQLTNLGASGNPFTSGISDVATSLLGGGGAKDQAPMINKAYSDYQSQLSPFLQASYLDPRNTPGFGDALSTLNSDITNQINSSFAGAGRDFSGMNTQTLARGLSQGEGGLIQNQYNQNVGTQLGAAGNLFNAGDATANYLTGLNQMSNANKQAGIGVADAANQASQYGPLLQLQAQSMTTGIPLQTLAAQAGIALPIASGFGTQTGTGTGTTSGTTQNTSPLWQQIAGGVLGGAAVLGGNQGLISAFQPKTKVG